MDLTTLLLALLPAQDVPLVHDIMVGGIALIALASLIVGRTQTPDPNTKVGKAYAILEKVALVTDKTKQKG
jgi:hypothetical protein